MMPITVFSRASGVFHQNIATDIAARPRLSLRIVFQNSISRTPRFELASLKAFASGVMSDTPAFFRVSLTPRLRHRENISLAASSSRLRHLS